MTCKIIFVQFGPCENYFTGIFFNEIYETKKSEIRYALVKEMTALLLNEAFLAKSPFKNRYRIAMNPLVRRFCDSNV